MNLIGHQDIITRLSSQHEQGTLPHAVGLFGPAHVGKTTVARWLAAMLLDTTVEKLDSHPDFLSVAQLQDEKTGKTKQTISVDQIREVSHRAYQKPLAGNQVVIIIHDAHLLHQSASNALLKVLEEPAKTTTFILVSSQKSALLPTIISRTACFHFRPVPTAEIMNGLTGDNASVLAQAAHGKPGLALSWQDDASLFEAYQTQVDRFLQLCQEPFYAQLKRVEELFGDKKDPIATRRQLINELGVWQETLLAMQQGPLSYATTTAKTPSPAATTKIYDTIEDARSQLAKNIHPRLVVEHILLSISSAT